MINYDFHKIFVEDAYNKIAKYFDKSRVRLWNKCKNFLDSIPKDKTIIDVGCGNCQLYNIIENFRWDFSYTGIDWSTPLLDSFDYKNKNNCEIICGDILKEETYKKKYDCAVVSHIVELVDSPEKLFYMLSKK